MISKMLKITQYAPSDLPSRVFVFCFFVAEPPGLVLGKTPQIREEKIFWR
jgi:hypothetical protein